MIDYRSENLDVDRLRTSTVNYLKNMDFDEDTCNMIADTGIENLKEEIGGFLKKYSSGDMEKAADGAHTIKGILWNMGLHDEGVLFKKVQVALLDKSSSEVVEKLIKEAFFSISK